MPRRAALAFSFAVAGIVAWTACVGDDPAAVDPNARGAQNQACFENGTCLAGLACVAGRCAVDADGNASSSSSSASSSSSSGNASSSSSSSSSSSGASGDGGGSDLCGNVSNIDHMICPKAGGDDDCNPTKPNCCVGTGCQVGTTCVAHPASPNPFVCLSSDHCAGSRLCCLDASIISLNPQECGLSQQLQPAGNTRPLCSAPGSPCPGGGLQLCSPGGKPCAGALTCRTVVVKFAGSDGAYVRNMNVCAN